MGSGAARTKVLDDRHKNRRRRVDLRYHAMRDEINRLRRHEANHECDAADLRAEILTTGARGVDLLRTQAQVISGFTDAQARLKRGFLSRLWFALGLAWRGRFV